MIEATKHQRLLVQDYGGDESTIVVPIELLDKVTALLDASRIAYWIDDETLAVDDEPAVAFIDFSNNQYDPARVQAILDSIP